MERIIRQLELTLNSIQLPLDSAYRDELNTCKDLLTHLKSAHRDEYKRIAFRCDTELYGDIMRLKYGTNSEVIGYGPDAVKDIVFDEMGFSPIDRYHLMQT